MLEGPKKHTVNQQQLTKTSAIAMDQEVSELLPEFSLAPFNVLNMVAKREFAAGSFIPSATAASHHGFGGCAATWAHGSRGRGQGSSACCIDHHISSSHRSSLARLPVKESD